LLCWAVVIVDVVVVLVVVDGITGVIGRLEYTKNKTLFIQRKETTEKNEHLISFSNLRMFYYL
jgi:hypothetical protein